MKHNQPGSRDKVLRLAYLPGIGSAFVLPLVTRLNAAQSPRLKAARVSWPASQLAEYGVALSTKLAMLSLIAGRVYPRLAGLYAELADHERVNEHLAAGAGWLTADRRLPYDLLLDVDCLLFEFRSCYEILGKFLVTFFDKVIGRPVTEEQLIEIPEKAGIDVAWVKDLRRHRILFFHETAPWLAVSLDTPQEGDRELLVLHSSEADPTDPAVALTFSRLRAIYGGMEAALNRIQDWALSELDRIDAEGK